MATLVLSVVGGVVGGPIGAALGALIGQQADRMILAPKGREGPRLADLKVQASTYGQQIPKIYGTMRVAGSVIWATDFVERRSKSGGGKGRPSVTEYSYSVSLAVALSARRISAIRRIWADGNLLRGPSGALYERGTMRLYTGSEDQRVDPLIAASVGMASASAFRGLSYVVLEGLELGSFGNRIPSLTFEVVADLTPQDSGTIANDLMGEAGRCIGQWPIQGYAASGDRLRDAMAPLFEADRIGLVSDGSDWRLAPAGMAAACVAIAGFSANGRPASAEDIRERKRQPLSALPGAIRLRHYEPERDYQTGQQSSMVAGGGAREEQVDLPAVLPAASARSLAAWLAAAVTDGRETLVWQGDLAALALPIGGLVRLGDGSKWRISGRMVRDNHVSIELARHQRIAPPNLNADPGAAVPAPEWPEAQGVVRLFDLPNLEPSAPTSPRIILAAAASHERWRGADCWFVGADGEEPVAIGRLRSVMAMGVLEEEAPIGSTYLIDQRHKLRVRLEHEGMGLESVNNSRLLAGANRAMLGGELIQFGAAELESGTQSEGRVWRLSRLLRAQGGQVVDGPHPAGTPFLLLDDHAVLPMVDSLAQRAGMGGAWVEWAERGDTLMHSVAVPSSANALRPLVPVHGRAQADENGGLWLSWIRRSRVNIGWRDEVDMPLGEAAELWRLTLHPPDSAKAMMAAWEISTPQFYLEPALVAQLPTGTAAQIIQVGDFASSAGLRIALP